MLRHPRERISRREFMRRSALAAAGVPAASAILAACSKPGGPTTGDIASIQIARPDNPVTLPINPSNQPIDDGLQPEKNATLKIYNWDNYIWKHVVGEFCAKYGATPEYTTFNNMESAIGKIATGQLDFDIFVPTVNYLGRLVATEYIQPLNHSYIPNLKKNIWPQLSASDKPFYDVGSQYSVPYVVYTTGIGYRRDVISDDMIRGMSNPYDIFWDSQYSGKVGVYDDYREALAMPMSRHAYPDLTSGKMKTLDLNTGDQSQIDQAKTDLISLIDAVNVRYSINGAYRFLPQGQYSLHQSWSGDLCAAWAYVNSYTEKSFETIGYWYPEDRKGPIGNDTMVIPKNAPHPVLAHLFLNYMLDFKNAMNNFSWVGYQPPQNDADPDTLTKTEGLYSKLSGWAPPVNLVPPWMSEAVVRKEDFDTGFQELELSPEVDAIWLDAWQQFQAGAGSASNVKPSASASPAA